MDKVKELLSDYLEIHGMYEVEIKEIAHYTDNGDLSVVFGHTTGIITRRTTDVDVSLWDITKFVYYKNNPSKIELPF